MIPANTDQHKLDNNDLEFWQTGSYNVHLLIGNGPVQSNGLTITDRCSRYEADRLNALLKMDRCSVPVCQEGQRHPAGNRKLMLCH